MNVSETVIYAGIIVGSLTMLGAVWVWARKQVFGLGGSLLSFFGTVLIGLSVFSRAQITIGETTIELQTRIETLEQERTQLAKQVTALSQNVDFQRDEIVELASSIQQTNPGITWRPAELPNNIDYSELRRLQRGVQTPARNQTENP